MQNNTKILWQWKMWKIVFKDDVMEEPKIITDTLKIIIERQIANNKPFKIDWVLYSPFSYIKITPYSESNEILSILEKESPQIQKKVRESMKYDKQKLTKWRLKRMIEIAKDNYM